MPAAEAAPAAVQAPPGPPVVGEVGRLGLVIPLAPFRERLGGESALRKILGAFRVTEKVAHGCPRGAAPAVRNAYRVERAGGVECLVIPRAKGPPFLRARSRAGLPLLDAVRFGADAPPPPRRLAAERCALEAPLYEYQEAVVEHLCGPGGPLALTDAAADPAAPCRGVAYVQMDTGLGKSRVGCAVIARCGEPALVVVPTEAIGEQWLDELAETYPALAAAFYHNPPKTSRRVPPGPATHDVVVVIVNTYRDKGPGFLDGYGLVVLDEAHEYHSPRNCQALWLSQTRRVLGLSATPSGLPSGLDRYVHVHLGPPLLPRDIPGFDAAAVNFRGAVRAVEYAGHPDHCETVLTPAGTMSAILTIGALIKDPHRMRLVAAEVERLVRRHEDPGAAELGLGPRPAAAATPAHPAGETRRHGVFVFAELREALPALRAALCERLAAAEIFAPELDAPPAPARVPAVSVLRGGVSRSAVSDARRAGAHVVLTTYGFSRRGISLPDMTSAVFATPRRNGHTQIVGRVLRRGSDESILREIVDIVDVRSGLRGQVADRRKVYAEKGYPVARVAARWEEYAGPAPDAPAAEPAPGADLGAATLDELLAMVVPGRVPGPAEPGAGADAGADTGVTLDDFFAAGPGSPRRGA